MNVEARIATTISRSVAPRKPMRVSEWAAANRIVTKKQSSEPGRWRNERNPLLVEPMDCFSARSPVQDVVCRFPIQFGKSELELNVVGYTMCEIGGPILVALPGQVSLDKWIDQKLNPLLEETPAVRRTLASVASRETANRRAFKDYDGGQLYLEHAGNPARLKSTSAQLTVGDEFSSFASALQTGDDPEEMLDGRASAYPATYKRLKVGTPEIKGICRIDALYTASDQRRWYIKCPECGHRQPLEWAGLVWTPDVSDCWYACRECGVQIDEGQKDTLIDAGSWVAENPGAATRGYATNCLYYKIGRGPRWLTLVKSWLAVQNDPAKLKTFINDRLAEAWEDPAMRAVKHNLIAERVEPRPLRPVPAWISAVTAGVDVQGNRLAVQIVGWGRGRCSWPIDYIELPGDPAGDDVWVALVDLINRPIPSERGGVLYVEATAIDAADGNRTEAVKAFVRDRKIRRPMAIFGAKANNAEVLSRGKMVDVNWRGQLDKRGVRLYQVGTVAIKHQLYSWLSLDNDRDPEKRMVRFSDELDSFYFGGLTSETFNPGKSRFEKKRNGPRNEPLDTWVYAFAATQHPEVRLNRLVKTDWDAREARLDVTPPIGSVPEGSRETSISPPVVPARSAVRRSAGVHTKEGWGL